MGADRKVPLEAEGPILEILLAQPCAEHHCSLVTIVLRKRDNRVTNASPLSHSVGLT